MNNARKTFIIAEAGVNHNGSLDAALELVEAAAEAGADAVKFQTFTADNVVTRTAPKAAYQKKLTGDAQSQYEMIKNLELPLEAFARIQEHCRKHHIAFLSTPFDLPSLHHLAKTLDIEILKLPSGEIVNTLLLLEAARTGKPILLSTGMTTLAEVERALGVLAYGYLESSLAPGTTPCAQAFQDAWNEEAGRACIAKNVTLLHCTSQYPAPFDSVHLRAMDTLASAFQTSIGLSDHTPGIAIPIAAVARGAAVIEKHFTLDRNLPGPDHQASLEPDELKAMICAIRQVEQALGEPYKICTACETDTRQVARRSLVAATSIKKGEHFTRSNLTVKRPGTGISAFYYWDMLGKISDRDYSPDDFIQAEGKECK